MRQRTTFAAVVVVVVVGLAVLAASPGFAGLQQVVDNNDTVVLTGNVHQLARPEFDAGAAPLGMPMERMILALRLAPEKQAALDQLLAEQQDLNSANFHQWLTPEDFGERFGPSQSEIDMVTDWLTSEGFVIEEVGKSRTWINFSGVVADVERAFHTQIRDYYVDGVLRHGNAWAPAIPRALSNVVAGVVSLHSFPRQAMNTGFHQLSATDAAAAAVKGHGVRPDWSGTANGTAGVYTSPNDWATIYDANSTYSTNGTGTGVKIGIVGRTNPGTTNWSTFRSVLGLPANTPTIIVNGTNPGDLGAGEDGEADLDAEWSGGVAKGATVDFVASKSTSSTDGVDLSAQYIVNNNLTDVMSTSFGSCEADMGSSENTFYNNLWSQAASQGITSCISTGDSGAAGCAPNGGNSTSGAGYAGVNGLASTPYNLAIGATQLSTSSSYWNGSGAAISYIPETPWNESGSVSGGSGLWSTSSGPSSTYAKPSWQVCTGVPTASHRYLPDVSVDGSDMFFGNYGMLVYTQGAMATTGGTSASSPSFAGVMALVVQKYGRQGNANAKLYPLGNAQYSSGGPAVFHDITSGNNNVPGLTGFTATAAWDEVSGLGTPDVTALVNNWSGSSTTYSISGTVSGAVTSGVTINLTGASTASTTTGTGGTYTFSGLTNGSYTVTPSLSGYTFSPASTPVTISSANVTGINFTSTAVPTYSISGTVSGAVTSGVTMNLTGAKTASTTTGTGGTYTFSGLANGSYTVTPSLSGYTFSPTSTPVTISSANVTGINFTASGGGGGGIVNGTFETGNLSGWTSSGTASVIAGAAHSGSYGAQLGSTSPTNGDSSIVQTFSVPSTGTSSLSFWYKNTCPDTVTYDWATATLKDNSTSTTSTVLAKTCTTTGTWTQKTFSLSANAGHSVTLTLTSHDDNYAGDATYTYYDDVVMTTTTGTPDFTISASPTTVSAVQGGSGTTTVTTAVSGGFSNAIALSATGLPTGATATFAPTSIAAPGSGSSTLTLTAGSSTTVGTYTVTITGTGGGTTHTTTVSFTVTPSGGPTTLFTNGFESSSGWASAQVSGTAGAWSLVTSGTYPTCSPHGGSYMAKFNSYNSASGSQTRYYRTSGFAVSSSYTTVSLKFYMYHDTGYSTYADKVQVQVSTNGTSWTNVGTAVARYNGTTGWAQASVDLSAYKGSSTLYIAFLGMSAYGNNEYLDDVTVTAQ
ncbi:MAG: protease pro-enzyme activation domain-containing protein [Thermoanaerobaculales bacterium]